MKRKVMTEKEKRAAWAENQHKAALINRKEAKMPFDKLKAKIGKELAREWKPVYYHDWLKTAHDLHTGVSDEGAWVSKSYSAAFCPWPRENSVWNDGPPTIRVQWCMQVIMLCDYWRLGLQGKGV